MSNDQKTALAVLFLVLALFVAALLLGFGQRRETGYQDPEEVDWAERLDALLVRREALRVSATSAPCRQRTRFVLAAGDRCMIRIEESDTPVREARLELVAGEVAVVLDQPGSVPEEVTLTAAHPREDLRVFASEEGRRATLELRCEGAADCTVRLLG